MNTIVLAHDTITLTRRYPHPPAALFNAYADVDQRIVWSAPSDEEDVAFTRHDFRVGGIDEFRCEVNGEASFAGTTRYEQIVADELIMYTERLVTADDRLAAMSLVTWSIAGDRDGSALTIIDQITSVAGTGPIDGSRAGFVAMLDQLARHLAHAS